MDKGVLGGRTVRIRQTFKRVRIYRVYRIVTMSLGFFWQIWRYHKKEQRRGVALTEAVWNNLWRSQARTLRQTALELEGMLIKLGQFLSARADLMPKPFIEELEELQDRISPVPFAEIKKQLVASYGSNLDAYFASIEETPLAAASLGQVHRAVLPTGEQVAAKIQRPGIEKMIYADLTATRMVIWVAGRFRAVRARVDLLAIYEEVARTTLEELDYYTEASHLTEFRRNFEGRPRIKIPAVYAELTRPRVLVMECMSGARITDAPFMAAHGLQPDDVARRYVQSFLYQVMVDGFFHADPHPGNVLLQENGDLIILDFGMMGRIDQRNREGLRDFLRAIVEEDARKMLVALRAMGVLVFPEADAEALFQSLSGLMSPYFSNHLLDNINDEVIQQILKTLQAFVYEQPVQLPYHLTFLGRAAGLIAGVATELDAQTPFLRIMQPFLVPGGRPQAQESAAGSAGSDAAHAEFDLLRDLGRFSDLLSIERIVGIVRLLWRLASPYRQLPQSLLGIAERLSTGHFRLEHVRDTVHAHTFHRLINRIAWLGGAGFFAVQGWFALAAGHTLLSVIGAVLALAFLGAAVRNTRSTEDAFTRERQSRR